DEQSFHGFVTNLLYLLSRLANMNMSRSYFRTVILPCLSSVLLLALGCKKSPPPNPEAQTQQPAPPNAIELVFTYGSEKEKWVNDVTASFNGSARRTGSGKQIFVRAIPMGSGECIDEILTGTRHTHITSPASAAFIKIGNSQSRARTGHDLIGPTENLVL